MIYIQLPRAEGFNKAGIKEFHYTEGFVTFRYYLYREDGTQSLENKSVLINVFDKKKVDKIKNINSKNLNCFDAFCKGLLQYLIDEEILEGTLEVK